MYISHIKIENFRLFGGGDDAFNLRLNPGLTAIVGENDSGKTTIIDALRFVLGTRDQETLRLDQSDFHHAADGELAREITIQLTFEGLTPQDRGAFAEYLTYSKPEQPDLAKLVITWLARRVERDGPGRRYLPVEWRTGELGDGPLLDAGARFLLMATYLRPLRDAERAMSAGRGSRLSQILQYTKEIKDKGAPFDHAKQPTPDPKTLSLLGLGDYTSHLIETSDGVQSTRTKLNDQYLAPLSFKGDTLGARVKISGSRDDATRLRQLLEKLEVSLSSADLADGAHSRGLGSNNILFMACELLLLGTEEDGFPLLLIEEPEAHLHPQRQLRLMSFLKAQADRKREDGQSIQIIVTTHSPNLASDVSLENLVLVRDGRAYPMASANTQLSKSDYRFLERFLDVTKANLFFARGVMIVEGDAENILVPTIAKLIGRDFREYGVSVVNVGGVGLRRYANIFLRMDPEKEGKLRTPVACVTDMDVMPDCAPLLLDKIKEGEPIPALAGSKRRWRVKSDFPGGKLEEKRQAIRSKAQGQSVETFVANEWTLEYDLAFFGLGEEVWMASRLADNDEKILAEKKSLADAGTEAKAAHAELVAKGYSAEELATRIYKDLAASSGISKPITAQYLAQILNIRTSAGKLTPACLRETLPPYLVAAIEHVTEPFEAPDPMDPGDDLPPDEAVDFGQNAVTDEE